jgi:uncharacterized C2H2 Zn-finger protein
MKMRRIRCPKGAAGLRLRKGKEIRKQTSAFFYLWSTNYMSPVRYIPEKGRTKERTRLRCNWKECSYAAPSLDELGQVSPPLDNHRSSIFIEFVSANQNSNCLLRSLHLEQHRQCPKEGCHWKDAKDDKQKRRHVWSFHAKWATQTSYPGIGGECPVCGKMFMRQDYVIRHRQKIHGGMITGGGEWDLGLHTARESL